MTATPSAILRRAAALLSCRYGGHALWVWLLWAVLVVSALTSPVALSDPALCVYLVDPELMALLVVLGVQTAQVEMRTGLQMLRRSISPGRTRCPRDRA